MSGSGSYTNFFPLNFVRKLKNGDHEYFKVYFLLSCWLIAPIVTDLCHSSYPSTCIQEKLGLGKLIRQLCGESSVKIKKSPKGGCLSLEFLVAYKKEAEKRGNEFKMP